MHPPLRVGKGKLEPFEIEQFYFRIRASISGWLMVLAGKPLVGEYGNIKINCKRWSLYKAKCISLSYTVYIV